MNPIIPSSNRDRMLLRAPTVFENSTQPWRNQGPLPEDQVIIFNDSKETSEHRFPSNFRMDNKKYSRIFCDTCLRNLWKRLRYSMPSRREITICLISGACESKEAAIGGGFVGLVSTVTQLWTIHTNPWVNVALHVLIVTIPITLFNAGKKIKVQMEEDTSFREWQVKAFYQDGFKEFREHLESSKDFSSLVCPITQMLIRHPVICHTLNDEGCPRFDSANKPILHTHNPYEREAIEDYLKGDSRCPMTRERISTKYLIMAEGYYKLALAGIRAITSDTTRPVHLTVKQGLQIYARVLLIDKRLLITIMRKKADELRKSGDITQDEFYGLLKLAQKQEDEVEDINF
jgi:hypothetical protein